MAGVLAAGLTVRVVLAFVVFRGRGFSADLDDFARWATTLDRVGPGKVYQADPTVNYPPVYLYVLDGLAKASHAVGAAFSVPAGQVLLDLLKLPAVLSDTALALVLRRIAARRWGTRAGLIAAASYLAVPVTWYDSAIWGQVDAVPTLASMLALWCLIENRDELAAAFAVVAVLTKPQAAIVLVVIVPVLLRRHLARPRTSAAGTSRSWRRLLAALLAACATAIVLLAPVDINHFAAPALARTPVVDALSGLVGLASSLTGQYLVLTANAYNLWALVGHPSLAATMHTQTVQWLPDATAGIAGLPDVTLGTAALLAVALLVVLGLLRTDGCVPIMFGYTVIAFAFFALPTRVHERYLFPAFASGAVLCAAAAARLAAYLASGTLSAVNLHAVLAAPLHVRTAPTPPKNSTPKTQLLPTATTPSVNATPHATDVRLPLAWLARTETTVLLVAISQTVVCLALIAAWLVTTLIRPHRT